MTPTVHAWILLPAVLFVAGAVASMCFCAYRIGYGLEHGYAASGKWSDLLAGGAGRRRGTLPVTAAVSFDWYGKLLERLIAHHCPNQQKIATLQADIIEEIEADLLERNYVVEAIDVTYDATSDELIVYTKVADSWSCKLFFLGAEARREPSLWR